MGNTTQSPNPGEPAAFAFDDVVVDARTHQFMRSGREIALEPKAFSVLLELLSHPGTLLSRDDLLDAVWGHAYVTPSTLSRIIAQLRRALADDSSQPRCIQTVHGLGYRFIAQLKDRSEASVPTLSFMPPARARLPERTHRLVGRDADLDQLEHLVRDNRLVTIVGVGGLGKTQAALEVSRRLSAEFPDGVWLFDCTSQGDEETLARWLAGLFDLRISLDTTELIARLGELLHARRALLVFDNCERIAGPVGKTIDTLLAASAEPHVLVTSQHRLNCPGEALYWLPPLGVPSAGQWDKEEDVALLSHVPAVELLLARSRAFASGFMLTPANAPAVARICQRAEGLPLALEIAAARLRLLSPEQLLERMDTHLLYLAEVSPSRPARHQTLHALIEWSFALLSERERKLLAGLSIFIGGCTLGGASAVGAALDLRDDHVMDVLYGLVDKSLLVVDTTTYPPFYRLLDSVRLFALEKLAEGIDEGRARAAHLAYFVQLAERVDAGIRGRHEQRWFDRVRRDWGNLDAALEYALSQPDRHAQALALAGNLCWYFRTHTDYAESARWLDRALDADAEPTRHRAQALIACGIMRHQSQWHDRSQTLLRDGIALARQMGDTWLAAAGLAVLAFELATSGDISEAEVCSTVALGVADARSDDWLRSLALLARGITCALDQRHREAEACLGDAFDAVSTPEHGMYQRSYVLINRALQRYYLDHLSGAASDWLACLDGFVELAHWRGAAGCVEGAAYLLSQHGEVEQAARFLAAAAHVRELTAAPLMPQWCKAQALVQHAVREALGDTFETLQRAGANARFELVAAEARAALVRLTTGQFLRGNASLPSGS